MPWTPRFLTFCQIWPAKAPPLRSARYRTGQRTFCQREKGGRGGNELVNKWARLDPMLPSASKASFYNRIVNL